MYVPRKLSLRQTKLIEFNAERVLKLIYLLFTERYNRSHDSRVYVTRNGLRFLSRQALSTRQHSSKLLQRYFLSLEQYNHREADARLMSWELEPKTRTHVKHFLLLYLFSGQFCGI